MKQNYMYLIFLLTISHRAFSMETKEELIKWFQDTEATAKNLEKIGSIQAFFYYGQLTDKPIPPYSKSPNPYQEAHEIEENAYTKILFKGDELEKEKKYENALTI